MGGVEEKKEKKSRGKRKVKRNLETTLNYEKIIFRFSS